MAEIIKTFKTPVPAMRFIGKIYGDEDRVDGHFGAKWREWYKNGWFDVLRQLGSPEGWDNDIALVGSRQNIFKYWIGKFTPAGTAVPEGFDFIDYEAGNIGTCRLKGQESTIWGNEPMCCDRLRDEGCEMMGKNFTCFERYLNSDETEDTNGLEEGHMVLDICFFLK